MFINGLLPNPVKIAKDAASAMQRFLKEVNVRTNTANTFVVFSSLLMDKVAVDEEKPRFTLSVLKFQTQSIVQCTFNCRILQFR